MVVIIRGTIDILLGFVISNIPNSTINQAIADFKLGAFHEYTPMVELSLDQTRFFGFSHEQIRDQLNAEDIRESFILLDAETTLSRSVWWVGRYLHEEEDDGAGMDQWRQSCVVNVSADERILLKVRLATTEVPGFHADDAIGNMDIFDLLDGLSHPFDPHGPQEPRPYAFDWEYDPPPPPPAYIVVTPDEYEKSSPAEQTPNFIVPAEGPTEVVRLKEAVARENGLRSEWTLGMPPWSEGAYPEGSLAFSQPWAPKD